MQLLQTHLLPLTCLLTLASAHFELLQPPPRGTNFDKITEYPCGGLPVSSKRTEVPLDDPELNIAMKMGHDHSAVQVLLALGSDPGRNFNITLVPTFGQMGLGDFCISDVELTEAKLGTRLTEGLEATLQVVTNGDPTGGLYSCADIVFTARASDDDDPSDDSCRNGTGVTARPFPESAAGINANQSKPNGEPQSGGSGGGGSGGNGGKSGGQGGEKPGSAAASLQTAAWGILAAVVLAVGALL
ncbi:hypothetical protein AJ78_01503 [Emergomyces pasteurianus Ep9510]|uniref:Copper acquisition factor BIM1-like domain-containing protein n=1 Tax=Emergomyces pasteurianus Ep9510 TaxID=1447872 RepID=A0A1J9QQI5_9EURO|nr:hypothetical protein AJ78_01503 [Emergomyces pasteurianus Ep9510]